jgi:hypothetical protein
MQDSRFADLFAFRRLSDLELEQYHEQGYCLYGRILTDLGLERMRAECMRAWNATKTAFDPHKTWLQNALLPDIHHHSETARQFYFHGPLVDVAEQLIGPNIKGATSQLTFKMRGNTKPFGWHQDNGYGELDPYNAITCLTALDDADVENGCLWIIPASHRQGQIPAPQQMTTAQKQAGTEVEVAADARQAMPAPLKAGECLIFHCWMLHKSEGNLSRDRDRRILFLRYADADAVEVYNDRRPRLGRLVRGRTRFAEVEQFEARLGE